MRIDSFLLFRNVDKQLYFRPKSPHLPSFSVAKKFLSQLLETKPKILINLTDIRDKKIMRKYGDLRWIKRH
ncbi:hypothetical protein COD11_06525 [Bacillus sp. AFS040349]|nr:hypothetical protein COD11_06525 [Bacillus sp. AFS040349]